MADQGMNLGSDSSPEAAAFPPLDSEGKEPGQGDEPEPSGLARGLNPEVPAFTAQEGQDYQPTDTQGDYMPSYHNYGVEQTQYLPSQQYRTLGYHPSLPPRPPVAAYLGQAFSGAMQHYHPAQYLHPAPPPPPHYPPQYQYPGAQGTNFGPAAGGFISGAGPSTSSAPVASLAGSGYGAKRRHDSISRSTHNASSQPDEESASGNLLGDAPVPTEGPGGLPLFQPMRMVAKWSSSGGAGRELSSYEKKQRLDLGISQNYMGDPTAASNQSANIPDWESCSFYMTNLPPNINAHLLFKAFRNVGRIFSLHINGPNEIHKTAAGKLVLFSAADAREFFRRYRHHHGTDHLVIQGLKPAVVRDRIKVKESDFPPTHSRVIIISGPPSVVNYDWLLEYFQKRFYFYIDEVIHLVVGQVYNSIEWHFGSYYCQASAAFQAINKELHHLGVMVKYARDPCDHSLPSPPCGTFSGRPLSPAFDPTNPWATMHGGKSPAEGLGSPQPADEKSPSPVPEIAQGPLEEGEEREEATALGSYKANINYAGQDGHGGFGLLHKGRPKYGGGGAGRIYGRTYGGGDVENWEEESEDDGHSYG
ncbi:hypothetical protein B0H63DRAFT_453497 [Podospora didyma]|uniref:RRM domain-containing protein n=1 Tax=Podospora didyma TaxID=330526 RepID=A0AAE0K9P0_9PEZI|nr:hypothetical protein B0H63DRAFT_453497 [Podospora didyma]